MNYPEWNKILWYAVLGVAFALEFLGVFDSSKATLTRLVCAAIPAWVRALCLGWIVWHFLIQNPN